MVRKPPHINLDPVHLLPGDSGVTPAEVVPVLDETEFDGSERLEALQAWKALTPLQRRICVEKLKNPAARNTEIARIVDCGAQTVARVIHTANFDQIADELAKAAKSELKLEAVSVVRKLLAARSESVRLKAALAVLADAGLLKDAEKTSNQNRKIEVTWKKSE